MLTHYIGIKSFVASLKTLPKVGWSFGSRYNPQVVQILENQGFSHYESLQIASNPSVRGFSSRLKRGSELFRLGVGALAQNALKKSNLLIENVSMKSDLPGLAMLCSQFVPCSASALSTMQTGRLYETFNMLLSNTDRVRGGGSVAPRDIVRKLIAIRKLLSQKKYLEANEMAKGTLKNVDEKIAAGGVGVNDPLLAYHYFLNIIIKRLVRNNPETGQIEDNSRFLFKEGSGKRSTQILVVDSKRERVLLQHRGLFKRLFADTWTVSANCKPKSNDDVKKLAAEALEDEIGLSVNPARFEAVGRKHGYRNRLISYDFYAFTPKEEVFLRKTAEKMQLPTGINLKYDERRRALILFSVDHLVERQAITDIADKIASNTSIPHVYPVFDVDDNSLLVIQLTSEEEKQAELIAQNKRMFLDSSMKKIQKGIEENVLKGVDSDEMAFIPIEDILRAVRLFPLGFALDLIGPYLWNKEVWLRIVHPHLINADSPDALEVAISGGKGKNIYILRELAKNHPELIVPDTTVVSTYVFDELVLANTGIRKKIEELQTLKETDEENIMRLSQSIRNEILAVDLPEQLKEQITDVMSRLGGCIAVRSSATVEDTKESAAAGEADSFINIVDPNEVFEKLKMVWASLFSDGFVKYRKNIHQGAKMAVLLQTYIPAQAAGVVTSITSKGRPVYNISAKNGIGEKIVQGKGLPDTFQVGLLADVVLEELTNENSLNHGQVLELARVVKLIHEHYWRNGLAENIDIEFVFSGEHFIIVQARSERVDQVKISNNSSVMVIDVVDEDNLPPGTVYEQLDPRSMVACSGAVWAKLQHVESHLPGDCKPNVILLTEHTANSWNAKFLGLRGVITTDGGSSSHAAKNSRVLNTPCLVGVPDAINILRKWNGQVVTMDAERKRVYLGKMPTKKIERDLNVWVSIRDNLTAIDKTWEQHEAQMGWEERKNRRPGITVEDFEGHWRGRSGGYPPFELDYYYRAWDCLTKYLNNRFAKRAPFLLTAQPRQYKEGSLFHEITGDSQGHILNFLSGLHDPALSISDAEQLLAERFAGFERFNTFMAEINELTGSNVEQVVDQLIDIFSWMHFAFWLNSLVETQFVKDQLKYLNKDYRATFKEAAAVSSDTVYKRDISREKDQAICSELEIIYANPSALAAFNSSDPSEIKIKLAESAPEILDVINSWSWKFKGNSENIELLSDTLVYLADIYERIKVGTFIELNAAALFLMRIIGPIKYTRGEVIQLMRSDPVFYSIIRGYARKLAAEAVLGSPLSETTDYNRLRLLSSLSVMDVDAYLGQAIDDVLRAFTDNSVKIINLVEVLSDNPQLKRTLSLSWQETYLKEDGHHLIVPLQRKIAYLMIDAAKNRPEIFKSPEDIFQLSTYELISLFKDDDPGYLSLTKCRNEKLRKAEFELVKSWSLDSNDFPVRLRGEIETKVATTGEEMKGSFRDALMLKGYIKDSYGTSGNLTDAAYALVSPEDMELPFPFGSERKLVFELIQKKKRALPGAVKHFAKETEGAIAILRQQIKSASNKTVKEYYKAEIVRLRARIHRLKEQLHKKSLI